MIKIDVFHAGNEQCEKRQGQIYVVLAHKKICPCLFS